MTWRHARHRVCTFSNSGLAVMRRPPSALAEVHRSVTGWAAALRRKLRHNTAASILLLFSLLFF